MSDTANDSNELLTSQLLDVPSEISGGVRRIGGSHQTDAGCLGLAGGELGRLGEDRHGERLAQRVAVAAHLDVAYLFIA